MITILVLEDEEKIYRLLLEALKQEGYSFVDEPESGGVIKIVRKGKQEKTFLREKVLRLKNTLFLEKDGSAYKAILDEIEKPLIEAVLEHTEGNQLKAAKILGINRNTLRIKMKKFNINPQYYK